MPTLPPKLSTRLRRVWTGSIQRRLTLGISALIAAVMLAYVFDLTYRQTKLLHQQQREAARALAQTLAANSVAQIATGDRAGLQEALLTVARYPDLRLARVLSREGRVLADIDASRVGQAADDAASRALLGAAPQAQDLLGDEQTIDVAAPIQRDGILLGWARVKLGQQAVNASVQTVARNGLIYAAVAIVFGALLAALLVRGLTLDLARLVRATRRIGAGERGVRSGLKREDELGQLSGALDRMVADLDDATRELHFSEAKFHGLAEQSLVGIAISGADQYQYVNRRFAEMFGGAVDEVLRRPPAELIAEADRARVLAITRQLLAGEIRDADYTCQGVRLDGSQFEIESHASCMELAGQAATIVVMLDISQRQRVEQALRHSEQSLKEAQRIAHVGNWELDLVANVLTWTEEIFRIFEIDPTRFGASYEAFLDGIHPDDRTLVDQAYRDSVASRTPYDIVHRLLMKDGRIKYVNERCETFYDPSGRPLRSIGTVQDVTERKLAEAARTQLAAIVQSSNEAIYGNDLDGIVTSWNPGAEKVYGYRTDEMIGRPVTVLAPAGRRQEVGELIAAVRRGETVASFETERCRKDGTRIDTALTLSPIRDGEGRLVGVSTIARDITERKQADRALRKVNRALTALSHCNTTLIHATDEILLLNELCRVIVKIAGYRMAWVGYVEHDAGQTVRLVAQSGYAPGLLAESNVTWADNERGRGPLGLAIRSGEIQVVTDVSTDPRFGPAGANADELGYGSLLVAPLIFEGQVIGALNIDADGANAFDDAEIKLLSELAADMAFGIATLRTRTAHEHSAKRVQSVMEATIGAIAATVEARDPYTAGHQRRVADLAVAIGREMGLSEDEARGLHLAGLVHDVGKIQTPSEILSKPSKLSRIEFELIKTHPEAGYEILKGIDFPWPIAQAVLQHHERIDGSGYPQGLKGDEILLIARILSVADIVEAMATHRPYRPALGLDVALDEISRHAGSFYDADVARACLTLFRENRFVLAQPEPRGSRGFDADLS